MSDHAASAEQTGITPAGSSKQPRFPDGWNWDETAWLYFDGGRYKAWVAPKAGLFVASWRLADGTWAYPWGEDPRHIFVNPYTAMAAAAERAEFAS